MKTITLIDNRYSKEESHVVLFDLLNDKINFLSRKIQSNEDRGLAVTIFEKRKSQLLNEREMLQNTLADFDDLELHISCEIQIK
jgi:hypothetical protein